MKTVHEYEPSDIDLKDPVHGFLMGQLLVAMLTGIKADPQDPPDADATYPLKRLIAGILNSAQKAGITIAPAVPEVFAR
jgi:hypothetical protein